MAWIIRTYLKICTRLDRTESDTKATPTICTHTHTLHTRVCSPAYFLAQAKNHLESIYSKLVKIATYILFAFPFA